MYEDNGRKKKNIFAAAVHGECYAALADRYRTGQITNKIQLRIRTEKKAPTKS